MKSEELPLRLQPVYAALLLNCTQKEAAHGLGLTYYTFKNYASQIYELFGVEGRIDLLFLKIKGINQRQAAPLID